MGEKAGEQCDDFGWHPTRKVSSSLVAETFQAPQYGIGRAWSTSAEYELAEKPGMIYLVFTVEGGFEFTVDGRAAMAETGSLILLDGEAPTTALAATGAARYVWYLRPTILDPKHSRFEFGEPREIDNAPLQSLISVTNVILNSSAPTSPRSRADLGIAVEHLVSGALAEASQDPTRDTRHHDGLFMAAQSAIDELYRDASLTIARLANALGVSSRTLHDTFAKFGTTPRREVERRRISEVHRIMQSGHLTMEDLAEVTGFGSPRRLHRALGRQTLQEG